MRFFSLAWSLEAGPKVIQPKSHDIASKHSDFQSSRSGFRLCSLLRRRRDNFAVTSHAQNLIGKKNNTGINTQKAPVNKLKRDRPPPLLHEHQRGKTGRNPTLIKTVVLNAMHLCTPFANVITIIEALVGDY